MLSAVFITDLSGKPLISRNYRGDIPLTKVEANLWVSLSLSASASGFPRILPYHLRSEGPLFKSQHLLLFDISV